MCMCIVNHDGCRFSNNVSGTKDVIALLADDHDGCFDVAMESTGPYWYGIYDQLRANGFNSC